MSCYCQLKLFCKRTFTNEFCAKRSKIVLLIAQGTRLKELLFLLLQMYRGKICKYNYT